MSLIGICHGQQINVSKNSADLMKLINISVYSIFCEEAKMKTYYGGKWRSTFKHAVGMRSH